MEFRRVVTVDPGGKGGGGGGHGVSFLKTAIDLPKLDMYIPHFPSVKPVVGQIQDWPFHGYLTPMDG